jgi:ribosomal protein S18 acetylase RimI-like enzyme
MRPFFHLRFDLLTQPLPAAPWPAGFHLEPFTPQKAEAMHSLLAQAYLAGGGNVGVFDSWWQKTRTDSEFDPALCFLVEDSKGDLAAAALCWTSAFVKDIAVRADCRRHGLGRALIATILETFQRRDFHAVELKVEKDNPSRAVSFYQQLGFAPKGHSHPDWLSLPEGLTAGP